ncbi:MAG: SGNH/GDSL hydrolase family protein [Clostridia bacterium]|nr:SGNH/GDSL hydrolase family protein [Clostridia bacterium]
MVIIMKILFQGDSITDVGRNAGSGSLTPIGQGYALLCAATLGAKYPMQFTFENRGISGNRIVDVYARIKVDGWNLSPDVFSILIGVNDVWHEFGNQNGVDAERFYRVYKMLVTDTMEQLPHIQMILMEPFVLNCGATAEHWDIFRGETEKRAEAVKQIASECGQIFLPLQKMLDDACGIAPASYWLGDGVHPTTAGHKLIADQWIKTFEEKILIPHT